MKDFCPNFSPDGAGGNAAPDPSEPLPYPMHVGMKVICVDDLFPVSVWEYTDVIPKAGCIYTVVRITYLPSPVTGECAHAFDLAEIAVGLAGEKVPGWNVSRFRPLKKTPPPSTVVAEQIQLPGFDAV